MEKTYVFDTNSGHTNDGMMGLIASLCQQRGLDPNMVAAMMNNRGEGYEGQWFIWVIFLFFLMGWGGNGFGGFGRNCQAEGNFLAGQLANDTGRELLMQAINGNAQAISQLSTTLNCDINAIQGALNGLQGQLCQVGNQVGMGTQQVVNAIQSGNCQLGNQLAQCCCSIQDSITRTNYENQISNLNQTNTLQNSINLVNSSVERGFAATAYETANQTCELKNAIAAQTQVINDKFCQLEMREMARENRDLRDQVQAYQLSASQQAQTANIVNQIRPCPTPAYVVPNPYGCGCNNYGYPFSNSCGCGSC